MLLEDDVKRLQSIPFFSKIEPNKLKLIAFTGERVTYKAGEVIFKKGDMGREVLVILEGEADVILPKADHNIHFAVVKKGEIIGEVAALCNVPRTMTLIAKTDCSFLTLSNELFIRLIREIPELAIQIIYDLAHRLASTLQHLDQIN